MNPNDPVRRNRMMTLPLIVIGGWSACLCLASLIVVGAFGFYAGRFYWFTSPFIVASGLCAATAIWGVSSRSQRSAVFWIVAPWQALLFPAFAFAMAQWPGGDDGPGMAWLLPVGGGSALASVLSFALMIRAWWVMRRTRNAEGAAPNGGPAMRLDNSIIVEGPPSVS
jgi:hypothetical protein